MKGALLLVYGFAHFGKSLLWQCSGLMFAFYMTEVLGFSPAIMGILLSASLLLNALCDLLNGWLMARIVRTFEAAALAQGLGAMVAASAFVGFAAAGFAAPEQRALSASAGLMMFRIGYSLLDVPQNSLLAFGARSDAARSRVSATRYTAAGLALLTVTLWAAPWLQVADRKTHAFDFTGLAVVLASVALVSSLALAILARGGIQVDRTEPAAAHTRDAEALPYRFALFSIIAFSGCVPLFSKLEAYFVAFALPGSGAAYFMVSVAIGQVLSQGVWGVLGSRLLPDRLYRLAAVSLAAIALAFAALAEVGGNGLLTLGFLYGAASSGLLMSIWSLLAASAQDPRTTTLRFGQFTFCSKLAQAAAAMLIGFLLESFPFASEEGRRMLVWLMAAGPLTAAVLSLVLSFLYRAGQRTSGQ